MKLEMTVSQWKTAMIKGVREMEAFDDRRFSLITVDGQVMVWGEGLRLRKWEMEQGVVVIDGQIDGISQPDAGTWEDVATEQASAAKDGVLIAWKKWFE